MKMRSPQTIGVELPRSGSGTRQRTFSFVVQCSGKFFSVQTPVPKGPRHADQLSARAQIDISRVATTTARQVAKHFIFMALNRCYPKS